MASWQKLNQLPQGPGCWASGKLQPKAPEAVCLALSELSQQPDLTAQGRVSPAPAQWMSRATLWPSLKLRLYRKEEGDEGKESENVGEEDMSKENREPREEEEKNKTTWQGQAVV